MDVFWLHWNHYSKVCPWSKCTHVCACTQHLLTCTRAHAHTHTPHPDEWIPSLLPFIICFSHFLPVTLPSVSASTLPLLLISPKSHPYFSLSPKAETLVCVWGGGGNRKRSPTPSSRPWIHLTVSEKSHFPADYVPQSQNPSLIHRQRCPELSQCHFPLNCTIFL